MGFDMGDIEIDVGDFAEASTGWRSGPTIFAGVALVSGVGSLTVVGILDLDDLGAARVERRRGDRERPDLVRDGLANALGSGLAALSESLDDETALGQVRIDSTPDSLQVVDSHLIFLAQVLVSPRSMQLVAAEYSKKLRRFVVFELEGGRRFRAQELARLMSIGKVAVPGFHQVRENYIRADPTTWLRTTCSGPSRPTSRPRSPCGTPEATPMSTADATSATHEATVVT